MNNFNSMKKITIKTLFVSTAFLILAAWMPLNSFAQSPSPKTPVVNACGSCPDMGGEGGWSVWEASTGIYDWNTGKITWNAGTMTPSAVPNGGGGGPRFNLTSGGAVDGCANGLVAIPAGAPGPPIPVVAPLFGNRSIQMGEPGKSGNSGGCPGQGCVERLQFCLSVTNADTNFVYAYAVVLEDPTGPAKHDGKQVPFAEIYILDNLTGDTVPCSHHKYKGDTTGTGAVPPGLYAGSCNGPGGPDVAYQPGRFMELT